MLTPERLLARFIWTAQSTAISARKMVEMHTIKEFVVDEAKHGKYSSNLQTTMHGSVKV